MVVQDLQPEGRNIACTLFGYSEQNSSVTTFGGNEENLFLMAIPDGIALKAKTPVTVYLAGVLTCRICLVYLLQQARKNPSKKKPPLIKLNTSDRPERVSGIGIAHWAVFFVLAVHLQEISNG